MEWFRFKITVLQKTFGLPNIILCRPEQQYPNEGAALHETESKSSVLAALQHLLSGPGTAVAAALVQCYIFSIDALKGEVN